MIHGWMLHDNIFLIPRLLKEPQQVIKPVIIVWECLMLSLNSNSVIEINKMFSDGSRNLNQTLLCLQVCPHA